MPFQTNTPTATSLGVAGALVDKGNWNATTNSPALASGTGTKGDYYYVSTAGTTTLDGISEWAVGDGLEFNGTVWRKLDNSALQAASNLSDLASASTSRTNLGLGTSAVHDASDFEPAGGSDTFAGTAVVIHPNPATAPDLFNAASNTDAAAGTAIAAAVAASAAGDTVFVNRDFTTTANLLKNGVNIDFGGHTGRFLGSGHMFHDIGSSGVAAKITNFNKLSHDDNQGDIFLITHASSVIEIKGHWVSNENTQYGQITTSGVTWENGGFAINQLAGVIYLDVDILDGAYGGVWWEGGKFYGRSMLCATTGNSSGGVQAIFATSATATDEFYYDVDHIRLVKGSSTPGCAIAFQGTGSAWRGWIITKLVESEGGLVSVGGAVLLYIIGEKLQQNTANPGLDTIDLADGADLYMIFQKLATRGQTTGFTTFNLGSDGADATTTSFIKIDHIDDSNGLPVDGLLRATKGTHFIEGLSCALSQAGNAFYVGAGTLCVTGFPVLSTQSGSTDLVQVGGTLSVDSAVAYSKSSGTITIRNAYGKQPRRVFRLATQFDKTNTTLGSIGSTALSFNATAGKVYRFRFAGDISADVVGGSKFSVGGTATATATAFSIILTDYSTNANTITARQTALAAASGQASTTSGHAIIEGYITVNAAGTLAPRFAQNAANGTSSVLVGATWEVEEML